MKRLTIVAVLALAGCATGGGLAEIKQVTRDDVQRGLEIAQAHDDPAGVACAGAILNHLNTMSAPKPTPNGAFSAFMEARELRRQINAGTAEDVHNACAPLELDAEITLIRLGLKAVPGGGVAGSLLRR